MDGGPKEKYIAIPVIPNTPIKIARIKEKAGEDVSIKILRGDSRKLEHVIRYT